MQSSIPSAQEIHAALSPMTLAQIQTLADKSGVPFTTLLKIKRAETDNPRLETVRALWPHVEALVTPEHPSPQHQETHL